MLEKLSREDVWNSFFDYRAGLAGGSAGLEELRSFIDSAGYLRVYQEITEGRDFPLPSKSVISKSSSEKKRTVYSYPPEENMVMKLLTYLVLRRYDGLFSPALYSFRPGRCAKDAVRRLISDPAVKNMYSYKADISNYFNSVDISLLQPELEAALEDDRELYEFLSRLLREPCVMDRGKRIYEKKGIMAGTPISSFYANLFLRGLDEYFCEKGIKYIRYSDDIIVFGNSEEDTEEYAGYIREYLSGRGLSVNPQKEVFSSPEEGWSFLGFSYRRGTVDISSVTVKKIKAKMRRKSRALLRWRERNNISGEKAAAAFIRIFRRKLLESPKDNELSWSFWFFSVINTADSLREIDRYAVDCIRYIITGTRRKSRFRVGYEDIKKLGFVSLVNSYYGDKLNRE